MLKSKIIRHFHRLKDIEQKKEFMKRNGIKFKCDRHHNVTVYADDGTLQLFPIIE